MSPDAQSTPLSPMSVSTSTCESPKPSTSFGSPKSQGSRNDPNLADQIKHLSLSLDSATSFMIYQLTKDPIFKSYSPNILHEEVYNQPGLDRIVIQTHTNTKDKRKFDKHHICLYCGKCVLKMGRHLCDKHSDKGEVKPILKMEKGSVERKDALFLLTLKGNFLHNCHVIKEQKGVLLVIRRVGEDTDPLNYIPCIYCLGFIQKRQAYRHVESCIELKKNQIITALKHNSIVHIVSLNIQKGF